MSTGYISLPYYGVIRSVATSGDLPTPATDGAVYYVDADTTFWRYRSDTGTWEQVQTTGTPTAHNALTSIQGGGVTERYHLTAAQHARLIKDIVREVVVDELGGGDFTDIQDAIDTITDAAAGKVYALKVYPGTYNGFTMKPFIEIIGVSNGPAAPIVTGRIISNFLNAGEWAVINRLSVIRTVASDGEVVCDFTGAVLVNDFFVLASTDQDYGFTCVYQNNTTFESTFYSAQIQAVSTYDGSSKDIIGLRQCGAQRALVANSNIEISAKASSGNLIGRTTCSSGSASWTGVGANNIVIDNQKSGSTANLIGSYTNQSTTGQRIASGDTIKLRGYGVGVGYELAAGNTQTFQAVGSTLFIDSTITGYTTRTALTDTQYIWLNSTNRDLPSTGAGLAIVTPYALVQTGFVAWGGSGSYWSYNAGTRAFTLDRRFTGLAKSSPVVAASGQTLSGASALTNFVANYLYSDSTGALKSTITKNEALFENNIPFGILYSDGTNYLFKKENHPASFPTAVSGYLHETSGNLLANNGGGNLTTLAAGDRAIKMVGASTLKDHGLNTTIPDSSGAAISFTSVYTGASGMAIDGTGLTAIPSKWQNTATTVANADNNDRIVVRIGALLDNLNSSVPQYVFVYHNQRYVNSTAASNAIAGGNITAFPQALIDLEVVQLGFACVTANGSGGGTLDTAVGTNGIVISKQVAGANLLSGAASNSAGNIINDVTAFDGILTSAETSAQLAFNKIDDFGKAGVFKIPSATEVQRDALTPSVGMMLVNTTSNKVQCYVNGTWVDLN